MTSIPTEEIVKKVEQLYHRKYKTECIDREEYRKRLSYILTFVLLRPEYKDYFKDINHEKISVATKNLL